MLWDQRVVGSNPISPTTNPDISEVSAQCDAEQTRNERNESDVDGRKRHGIITDDLSASAFNGRHVFLQECADALDLDVKRHVSRARPEVCIYFIGGEQGPIKIGTATQPYERLRTLQVGHPDELFLYAYGAGNRRVERELHSEFASDRIRGEWFQRTDRILRRILFFQDLERTALTTNAKEPRNG